jgi:ABC-type transporter Mla maintaining outer membrane lipid asymmetry ATPase subunit MlaF
MDGYDPSCRSFLYWKLNGGKSAKAVDTRSMTLAIVIITHDNNGAEGISYRCLVLVDEILAIESEVDHRNILKRILIDQSLRR